MLPAPPYPYIISGMWKTIGHERAVTFLKRGLELGRTSHAYLVAGPARVGKRTLALDLAAALNCAGSDRPCGQCGQCHRIAGGLHTDVRVLSLEGVEWDQGRSRVSIGIDQVREVRKDASIKPFEGGYRVFIFDGAEHLTGAAANSLLKLLEEPPDQVVLILLTSDQAALPSTIVSRCQMLEVRPLPLHIVTQALQDGHGADSDTATEIARLSGGRLGWALEAVARPEVLEERADRLAAVVNMVGAGLESRFAYATALSSSFLRSRDTVREEFRLWLDWWRDLLLIKQGGPDYVNNLSKTDLLTRMAASMTSVEITAAIGCVQETWELLERNVNPRLAIEEMMLVLPRPSETVTAVTEGQL